MYHNCKQLIRYIKIMVLQSYMQETSVMSPLKDLHHSLRNYSRLQKSLHAAMEECLSSDPVYLRIEARYAIKISVSHRKQWYIII